MAAARLVFTPEAAIGFCRDPVASWDGYASVSPELQHSPRRASCLTGIRQHASELTPNIMKYAGELVKQLKVDHAPQAVESIISEIADVEAQLRKRRKLRFERMARKLLPQSKVWRFYKKRQSNTLQAAPKRRTCARTRLSSPARTACLCALRSDDGKCIACRERDVLLDGPAVEADEPAPRAG